MQALVIALAFMVSVVSEVQIPIARITDSLQNKIALEVLKVSPVNTVVSAFLLRFPLCKLAQIAQGRAKIELMIALGFPTGEMLNKCYSEFKTQLYFTKRTDLLTASKMYINEALDVDNRFMANSTTNYGFRVEKIGFKYPKAAVNFVNKWVESEMLKRVTNIVDQEDIDSNTSLVILNAAHFKGTWDTPFYIQMTAEKKFRNLNGTVFKVPMMVTSEDMMFIDDPNLDVKLFSKDFTETTITFALPQSIGGLPSFIDKIHEDRNVMKRLRAAMRRKVLTVSIPRFKIKTYVDWSGFLRMAGVNRIFNTAKSGLGAILKKDNNAKVFLSKVKQKVFLEIDEFGAVRKPPDTKSRDFERLNAHIDKGDELTLDRPFYFVVSFRQDNKEYEMFNGVYYGPQEV